MLGTGARIGFDEIVDLTTQHAAVGVPQEVGHPLVDIGDDTAVIGDPDPFLGHVDQLLEPLLALLEGAGPLLQSGLPSLVRLGMTQRRPHQPTQQTQRLGIPVGEGVGLR